MRKFFALGLLLLLTVSDAQAAWVWTPQTRRWVNPKYAAKDTPKAQMDWAVGFFEARDYDRASKEFTRLVRSYPRSELAPEAQYLAGVSFELMRRPGAALTAYKRVVEIYPFSQRFKDSIEREFLIAEQFFSGTRVELVGPIKVPALDKAIEIYEHVVQHAPYGDFADRAQMRLGECFLRERRYEEANRAFQKVLDEYPGSPLIEKAKFNVAFCARQLSLKASYDQSATDEAIGWYEKFIASHPDGELLAQAQESLKSLKAIKAEGLAQIAHFYEIKGKPESAIVYYRDILQNYPETETAAKAVARLQELGQKSQAEKK